ncbi:MAG TPA: hypothetical protein VFR81_24960 [Longimicrobium sp.]|nr:hypothetical protein [Longimicrobium sp.]
MYRHCISCSADLGANEALESFPVGGRIAFDGEKGRLWAVCPKCARWNLSPIEERWEAVEEAERRFADARLRVQSENVGMARLPDGTRLIRVGQALPGELAAWRYGGQLLRRRRGYLIATGAAVGIGIAAVGGLAAAGIGFGIANFAGLFANAWKKRQDAKVIHRVAAPGGDLLLRRWHARSAVLRTAEGGGAIELLVPDAGLEKPKEGWGGNPKFSGDVTVLSDADARAFLRRGMVHVNEKGASRASLGDAVSLLERAGGAAEFLSSVGGSGRPVAKRPDMGNHLVPSAALAVEMALHEAEERRAMKGELTLLEAAWREAEEIAGIADGLAAQMGGARLFGRGG